MNMDSINRAINNIHSAWPDGNYHLSSMPSIYSPQVEPKTCPSDYMIKGLYHTSNVTSIHDHSISDSVTSMLGQEPWLQVHSLVSGNYMNSRENTIGDVIYNMQSKTGAEPQIHNHPYVLSTEKVLPIDCDVFNPCCNMVLPDLQLGQNMNFNSCDLQPKDPTTNQLSELWVASVDWSDCIQQL